MKNINLILVLFSALFIISSCQKEYVDEFATATTPSSSSSKPKTYSEKIITPAGRDSITFNLSYDAAGRLTSMVSASSPGDKFIYLYTGNTIKVEIYNSNVISITSFIFLNASSYLDSTFQYYDTKDTSTSKYFYNTNNQLTKMVEYDYKKATGAVIMNITNYTYDSNGNLIKEADNFETNTYTYTTLPNNLSLGFDFLPRPKYLVQTTTNVSGGVNTTLNHTYTFDSSNRLTSERVVQSDGVIIIKSYTY